MAKRIFVFWISLITVWVGVASVDLIMAQCAAGHHCRFFPGWFNFSMLALYAAGSFLVALEITRSVWKRIFLAVWMFLYGLVAANIARYIIGFVIG